MPKPAASLVFLFLFSCNSPEARLDRLQHNFWEKFARQDFYEIKLKNEVLHLPLPPSPDRPKQQKALTERLQKEANSIEKETLSVADQKQLAQLRSALDVCVAQAGNPFFDPSRYAVLEHLRQYSEHPELSVLLEKIPAYYAQIEQRWQRPDARFVSKAVAESQSALDLLNELQEKLGDDIGGSKIEATQFAIKDFIGLCQSALL